MRGPTSSEGAARKAPVLWSIRSKSATACGPFRRSPSLNWAKSLVLQALRSIESDPLVLGPVRLEIENSFERALHIGRTRPGRFVVDESTESDDPSHVGKQAIRTMRCSGEVIEQGLPAYVAVLAKSARIAALVIHRSVVPVIFAGMRFARVNENRTHGPAGIAAGECFHRIGRHRAERSGERPKLL